MNKEQVLAKIDGFCRENGIQLYFFGCDCCGRVLIKHQDEVLDNRENDSAEFQFGIDDAEIEAGLLDIDRPENDFTVTFSNFESEDDDDDEFTDFDVDADIVDTEGLLVEGMEQINETSED